MKTKYKFVGSHDGILTWISVLPIAPNESRHNLVTAEAEWFWNPFGHEACS